MKIEIIRIIRIIALMDVAVTDDPTLSKKFNVQFYSLLFLEYSFDNKKY